MIFTPGAEASRLRTSPALIGEVHSKLSATECARSTGTRTQVALMRKFGSANILRVSCMTFAFLLVVAGSRIDLGVVAEKVERVRMRQHLGRKWPILQKGARGVS